MPYRRRRSYRPRRRTRRRSYGGRRRRYPLYRRRPKATFSVLKKFTVSEQVLIGQNAAGPGVATNLPFDFQKTFKLNDIPAIDFTAMSRLWALAGIQKVHCVFTPNGNISTNQNAFLCYSYEDPSNDNQVGQPITGDSMTNRYGAKRSFWGASDQKNIHSMTVRPRPLNNIFAGLVQPDAYVPMNKRRTVYLDLHAAAAGEVPHWSITVAFVPGQGDLVSAPLNFSFNLNCRYTYSIILKRPV